MTTYEIRSYTLNGDAWEWNGDGWESTELSTDGDFSAYSEGEPIKLAAIDADGEEIASAVGVVRGGHFENA